MHPSYIKRNHQSNGRVHEAQCQLWTEETEGSSCRPWRWWSLYSLKQSNSVLLSGLWLQRLYRPLRLGEPESQAPTQSSTITANVKAKWRVHIWRVLSSDVVYVWRSWGGVEIQNFSCTQSREPKKSGLKKIAVMSISTNTAQQQQLLRLVSYSTSILPKQCLELICFFFLYFTVGVVRWADSR